MKVPLELFIFSFYLVTTSLGLSCLEVKTAGSGSKFSVEALKTLPDDSILSCLLYLGKDPLSYEEGKHIWMRLLKMHQGDVSNIPENVLQQLGWITRAIPPKDIKNLTLSDIDTIAAFGQYHNLTQLQLQALAESVRDDWSAKEPSDYTFYDLMALNHILCGFNATYIGLIHPDSYKEAANVLSTLQDCPPEPLEALASLAVSYSAFDDPSTWHSSQAKSVGCILNGMSGDAIASIPPEGMESLTPDVMPCLLKETLKSFTIWQLKHLTPSAANAISHTQKSFLSFEQQKSINEAILGNIGVNNSNFGVSLRPTLTGASLFGFYFLTHFTKSDCPWLPGKIPSQGRDLSQPPLTRRFTETFFPWTPEHSNKNFFLRRTVQRLTYALPDHQRMEFCI